jgi:hypothetical protein
MHNCQLGPHENERWGFVQCNIIGRLTLVGIYLTRGTLRASEIFGFRAAVARACRSLCGLQTSAPQKTTDFTSAQSMTCYRDGVCAKEKQDCWFASCASLSMSIASTKMPFDYTQTFEYLKNTGASFPLGLAPVSFIMDSSIAVSDKIQWLKDIADAGYVDAVAARQKLNEIYKSGDMRNSDSQK